MIIKKFSEFINERFNTNLHQISEKDLTQIIRDINPGESVLIMDNNSELFNSVEINQTENANMLQPLYLRGVIFIDAETSSPEELDFDGQHKRLFVINNIHKAEDNVLKQIMMHVLNDELNAYVCFADQNEDNELLRSPHFTDRFNYVYQA